MTKIRNITFGYSIVNGETMVYKNEAKTVIRIFELYIQGTSLGHIANILSAEKVNYSDTTSDWNKSRVSRVLDNAKYIGADNYPAIISKSVFEKAHKMKAAKQGNKDSIDSEFSALLHCEECGSRLLKRTAHKKQVLYCKCCGKYINDSYSSVSDRIKRIYDHVANNPVLLIPKDRSEINAIKPDIKLHEFRRKLSQIDFDQDEILQIIFDIAKIEYNVSDAGSDILARRLRNRIKRESCDGKVSVEFIQEYIDKVCVDKRGNIILHMTTGVQISERSVIDGGHKNTEKNGELT